MEKYNIKISVIVPVYNTSKYLEKCIESILNQSLKEIEVICINDGSIDNSLEILEKFSKQDRRVKVINQINKGLTATRNIGLRLAKGKYIINIDSDDWIEKDYFENIYKKAKENNLDMVISDILFDFKDKIILKKDLEISDEKIITGKEYMKVFFKNGGLGYSWNKLIKREIYSKNNIYFNEAIFAIEDVEFITRLSYFLRLCHNKQLINSHFYRGVSELPYKLLFAVIYTHLEFRYEMSHTITSHHVHHFHQTRIPDGTLLDYMVQYRKPLFPQFFLYPKKFLPENNPHHKEFHLRPYIQNNANQ